MDVGTGDGRAAVAIARADPGAFVVGLDADAAAMREVSRRAARPPDRGGAPNVIFVVAAAERPPAELLGRADELRVVLPWGSLLRGVVGLDADVTAGLVALARPGAPIEALVSLSSGDDRATGAAVVDLVSGTRPAAIEAAWAAAGATLVDVRPATPAELAATGSTWAKRLGLTRPGAGRPDRTAWRLVARRAAPLPSPTR